MICRSTITHIFYAHLLFSGGSVVNEEVVFSEYDKIPSECTTTKKLHTLFKTFQYRLQFQNKGIIALITRNDLFLYHINYSWNRNGVYNGSISERNMPRSARSRPQNILNARCVYMQFVWILNITILLIIAKKQMFKANIVLIF